MLVIMRRVGEALMIGDDVRLVVIGTKGDETRIGIDAPDKVKILRSELYKKSQPKQYNNNSQ